MRDSIERLDVWDNEAFYGSSNLYLSARDLARWTNAWLDNDVLPEGVREQAMAIPELEASGASALNRANWYFGDPPGPFHFNGHLRGFHHTAYWDPASRVSVVWVTNVLEPRPNPQLLTRALLRAARGESGPDLAGVRFERGSGSAASGDYRLPGIGLIRFEGDGELATLRVEAGALHDGFPSDGYYFPDFDAEVGFSELRDGRYHRIHWLTVFDSMTGRRIEP